MAIKKILQLLQYTQSIFNLWATAYGGFNYKVEPVCFASDIQSFMLDLLGF
jgi:hypothetical protein